MLLNPLLYRPHTHVKWGKYSMKVKYTTVDGVVVLKGQTKQLMIRQHEHQTVLGVLKSVSVSTEAQVTMTQSQSKQSACKRAKWSELNNVHIIFVHLRRCPMFKIT